MKVVLEHLSDQETYQCLSPEESQAQATTFRQSIEKYMRDYQHAITEEDLKYLQRSIQQSTNPFSVFYITAKIHKEPWKPRPICSTTGSLSYGLGKYVNKLLQPIIQRLPSYLKRVADLTLDPTARYSFLPVMHSRCTQTSHRSQIMPSK
jgi:hypothetical protein